MKEINRISQHRRDFYADYKCEECGHIENHISGYDDTYFHTEVVPAMKCKKCNKSSIDLNSTIEDRTIIPAGIVI